MDDKTILFVFGDHGMTSTGDHGGESESEVTAAMFVHSKQPLRDNILSNTRTFKAVKQVDLVPTIAHIMGVPIPYSNLGAVILDSLPITQSNERWLNTLHSIWSNVVQVNRYISAYENTTGSLTSDTAFNVQADFERISQAFKLIANEDDFRLFAVDAYKFIKNVRLSCERIWTQFDAFSMSRGLLLTSFVATAVYLVVNGIGGAKLQDIITSKFVLLGYVGIAVSGLGGVILYYLSFTDNLLNTVYFATGLFAVSYLFILVIQKFEQISTELHNSWRKRGWVEIISRFLFILSFLMVFTNSFIINEAKVMLFISVTLTIIIALDVNYESCFEVRSFTRKIVLSILFVICLIIRSSVYFWGCRDEDNCISILNKWGNSNKLQLFIAFCALSFYVVSSRVWLRSCGNLTGYNINVLVAKCLPFVIVICCSGIWVVQHMPREQLVAAWQSDGLAWIIYAFVISAIINVFVNPLHIYTVPSKQQQSSVVENKNIIPHLFKQMRDMFGTTKGSNHNIPIVYGLATVYTSAFLIVALYFSLIYLLLLGDIVTPGGVLMLILAALVVTLCAISRYEKSQSIENLLEVPFSQVLLWFALSMYAFYGTKHQPTFTNIVWESAFVGTSGTFTSNIIPATLVLINTFGCYILFGFTIPLLVIAPFSLYVMFPSLSNKKHGAFKNLSKGDFTLYDFEEAFGSTVFSACCKYILCHTIRTFGCMLSATIHCRHLMVWAIFAPKLIFDALGTFLTILAVLLGYLLVIRIQMTLNSFVILIQKAR